MRKLLSIILFLFITHLSYGQTFTQTFVDRCTGEVQVVTANFQTGSAVVSFYNRVRLFTYQQYVNGELQQWLGETYAWWNALSPCSTAQTQATQAQNTANNATSNAANATNNTNTTGGSTSSGSTSSGSTSSGSTGGDTGGSTGGDTGGSTGGDGGSGSSGGSDGGGDGSGSSGGDGDGSSGGGDGSGGDGDGSSGGDGDGDGDGSGGDGDGDGEGSGEEKKEEEKKEEEKKEEEKKEEEKEEESKEEEKEEESEEESDEEESEEESEEEDEEESEEEKKEEEEEEKKEKQKKFNPIQLKADMLTMQSIRLDYNAVLNIGASQTSIYGDRTNSANLMIWDNLNQASIGVNSSVVSMTEDYQVSWIDSYGVNYMRNYGMNVLTAMGSRMKPLGKWGTVGVGVNYSYMFGKDSFGGKMPDIYSLGYNFLYTNSFQIHDRILYSPAIIGAQNPITHISRSLDSPEFSSTTSDFIGILANSFTIQLTRRFSFNVGWTLIYSSNEFVPLMNSFMIGAKLPF